MDKVLLKSPQSAQCYLESFSTTFNLHEHTRPCLSWVDEMTSERHSIGACHARHVLNYKGVTFGSQERVFHLSILLGRQKEIKIEV